ncbi:MAG: hypothetical protein SOT91_01910 [Bacilli bacterium]|jgi:hypothetical protein|nr:hypothetical protein [Clostridium sp.]MDY2804106.1 hypothetical protein [Bacilli bacterium]
MITQTIDISNVKKILKCCPHYDDIINSEVDYEDELSFDLIDWYKDLIFSCNADNEEEVKIIRLIDRSLYMYVNSYKYKIGLKKIIDIKDIDLNSDKSIKNLIKKIINYTTKYENNEILNITSGRWL